MTSRWTSAVLLAFFSVRSMAAERIDVACLVLEDGYWQVASLDVKSGRARVLSRTAVDKTRLSFFPDGHLLVNRNDGTLSVLDPVSGSESVITLKQQPVLDARVSPDGARIAFSFNTAIDGNDLWIIEWPSQKVERVLQMPALQHEPVWSQDSHTVYFLSGDGGQAHDIWRYDPAKETKEQLTAGELYHFDVAVAVDGRIAYSSNRDGNYELYLRHPDGKTERLTDEPGLDASPTFVPDSASLLFESSRSGGMGIYSIDLKSRHVTRVTTAASGARQPVWRTPSATAWGQRSWE